MNFRVPGLAALADCVICIRKYRKLLFDMSIETQSQIFISYTHLHRDRRVRLIIVHYEVVRAPSVDVAACFALDLQRWESSGFSRQLGFQRVGVVEVDVRVPHCVGEAAGHQIACSREHVRKQCVRRDVEGHAEPHVA